MTDKETKMAKKKISKLSDKLDKINESFSIYIYDNGYMVEVSGRDSSDEYKTAKIMVGSVEELIALVKEATEMDIDN